MDALEPDKIESELSKLDVAWAVLGGHTLNRVFEQSFDEGVVLVNAIAKVAKTMQHHPEVRLSYDKVELNLTTHSAAGLTEKDFEFAQKIDALVS